MKPSSRNDVLTTAAGLWCRGAGDVRNLGSCPNGLDFLFLNRILIGYRSSCNQSGVFPFLSFFGNFTPKVRSGNELCSLCLNWNEFRFDFTFPKKEKKENALWRFVSCRPAKTLLRCAGTARRCGCSRPLAGLCWSSLSIFRDGRSANRLRNAAASRPVCRDGTWRWIQWRTSTWPTEIVSLWITRNGRRWNKNYLLFTSANMSDFHRMNPGKWEGNV